MREIPDLAVDFIADHEGCRLTAYQDSVGVWTIGYGHAGLEVHGGLRITLEQAKAILKLDLAIAGKRLAGIVRSEVIAALTDNQYAALISFVFNVGANASWTIWKRLNTRQFDQVPLEMAKFVNGRVNGKLVKIAGLVNRRAAEVKLWSTAEPGSLAIDLPSSQSQRMVTPPTPADPTPPAKSAVIVTSVTGAVLSAPGLITQVKETLAPAADASPTIAQAITFLSIAGAVLAVIGLVLIWAHKQAARS